MIINLNKIKENKFIVYGTLALTLFMVIAHLNPSLASMIQLGGNKSTIYSPMGIPIGLIIGCIVLIFSGSYTHQTKSGKKDKRFKNNKYNSTLSNNGQMIALKVILISLLSLIIYYLIALIFF